MKAYKFLRSDDIEKVTKGHTLWLSSARSIRAQEAPDSAGYGDALELGARWAPEESVHLLTQDHPLYQRGGLIYPGHDVRLRVPAGVPWHFHSDALMFCASLDRAPETVDRMKSEFGYDASFEIVDFRKLAASISRCLGNIACTAGPAVYEDINSESLKALDRSSFHKPVRFQWQHEVRILCPLDGDSRAVRIPGIWRFVGSVRRH